MKKTEEQEILWQAIETAMTITCLSCKTLEKSQTFKDEFDFSESLIEKGWRTTWKLKIYCPECAKKQRMKPFRKDKDERQKPANQ